MFSLSFSATQWWIFMSAHAPSHILSLLCELRVQFLDVRGAESMPSLSSSQIAYNDIGLIGLLLPVTTVLSIVFIITCTSFYLLIYILKHRRLGKSMKLWNCFPLRKTHVQLIVISWGMLRSDLLNAQVEHQECSLYSRKQGNPYWRSLKKFQA